ncbi:MAG: hypothetical protein AAGH65_08655 [Pseudomonadota bacterium]
MLNTTSQHQGQERSDMDINSIESNSLDAMMVEHDLIEWLQEDDQADRIEDTMYQTAAGHA